LSQKRDGQAAGVVIVLREHLNAVEQNLLSLSKTAANLSHPVNKGSARENFVKEFLEKHISDRLSIGIGEIIDSTSMPKEPRNQFDVLLYNGWYPRIEISGINCLLSESVVSTIEVKSTLDKDGLTQAVLAARKSKELKRNFVQGVKMGYTPPSILNFLVAYNGPASMDTVYKWLKDVHAEHGNLESYDPIPVETPRHSMISPSLDGIYILGKGMIQFDNKLVTIISKEDREKSPLSKWEVKDTDKDNLLFLFLAITQACIGFSTSTVDMASYLKGQSFGVSKFLE
jgi:hypothetical protein